MVEVIKSVLNDAKKKSSVGAEKENSSRADKERPKSRGEDEKEIKEEARIPWMVKELYGEYERYYDEKKKERVPLMLREIYGEYERYYDEMDNDGRAGKEIKKVQLGTKRGANQTLNSVSARPKRRQKRTEEKFEIYQVARTYCVCSQ